MKIENFKLKISGRNGQAGTTLIEVIIYIAILSFVMIGALMATYQILSGSESLSNKNITEEEAGFIIAKLNWALNDVSAINNPSPNSSGDTLSVSKNGYSSNPIVFTRSGNDITITKGSSPAVTFNLNTDRVGITALTFEFVRRTGSANTDSIKTTFIINGKTFETIRYIR
jgi:hypothetical protein